MSRVTTIAISSVVFVGLTFNPARAHLQRKSDGDDSGRLDIQNMRFSHAPRKIYLKVRTDGRWRSRLLKRNRYVRIDLDPRGGNRQGYAVRAKFRHGNLRGIVYRINRDHSYTRVGKARTSRPDKKAIRFEVKRRLIRAKDGRLRWSVQTYARGHYDTAPSEKPGTYRHRL
jgi:hypothetical protein